MVVHFLYHHGTVLCTIIKISLVDNPHHFFRNEAVIYSGLLWFEKMIRQPENWLQFVAISTKKRPKGR